MDPDQFFAASRVLIVAGKGGVGKTVVSAVVARAAARRGLDALLIDVQGRSGLGHLLGADEITYETRELLSDPSGGRIRARVLSPDEALVEWLEDHGMKAIARRMARSGVLEVVATATPGIKDLLVLAKVKQLERAGEADLIVLDAPAAGHAITFMQSARQLRDTARVGAINKQAADVLEMLHDPTRCRVLMVTLAEETPVNESVETAFALEDEVGVALGPVVVNGTYPELAGLAHDPPVVDGAVAEDLRRAGTLRRHRTELQQTQIDRLSEALPLPRLELGHRFGGDLEPADIDAMADELVAALTALPEPRESA